MTAENTTPTLATTRIVIVSGNEYQVPLAATEAELRNHLKTMFPDVTNAMLQRGRRVVEGVEFETWEFVKRAGTKGATGGEMAALLAQVPPLPSPLIGRNARELLDKYLRGVATIGEVVDGDLIGIVNALPTNNQIRNGGDLCRLVDMLPAAPGSDITGW